MAVHINTTPTFVGNRYDGKRLEVQADFTQRNGELCKQEILAAKQPRIYDGGNRKAVKCWKDNRRAQYKQGRRNR